MPLEDLFTKIILPSLTVLVGAAGVAGALAQLTANSRLRKRAEWWRTELENAELAHDRAVFQSLYRRTMGELIARNAVPLLRVADAIVGIFMALSLSITSGIILATSPGLPSFIVSPLFLLLAVLGMYISVGQCSLLRWHRQQVLRSFLDGIDMQSSHYMLPDRKEQATLLTKREKKEVQILSVTISVAAVAVAYAVSTAISGSSGPLWGSIMASGATISCLYTAYAVMATREYGSADRWTHPRALTARAGVRVTYPDTSKAAE